MAKRRKPKLSPWSVGPFEAGTNVRHCLARRRAGMSREEWEKAGRPNWYVALTVVGDDGKPHVLHDATNVPACVDAVLPVESPHPIVGASLAVSHDDDAAVPSAETRPVENVNLPAQRRFELWGTGQRIVFPRPSVTFEQAQTSSPAFTDPDFFNPDRSAFHA